VSEDLTDTLPGLSRVVNSLLTYLLTYLRRTWRSRRRWRQLGLRYVKKRITSIPGVKSWVAFWQIDWTWFNVCTNTI